MKEPPQAFRELADALEVYATLRRIEMLHKILRAKKLLETR
jgi:hypothetical protein